MKRTGGPDMTKLAGDSTRPRGMLPVVVEMAAAGVAVAFLAAILFPVVSRSIERSSKLGRVDALIERASFDGRTPAPADLLLSLDPVGPELASWGNIGGCGVTGGGGGGGARWIGRRTGGAPIEFEALGSHSAGEDLTSNSITFKVTGDVPGRLNVGFQVPYLANSKRLDPAAIPPGVPDPIGTFGFGDLTLLATRQFGMEGDTSASISLGLPTAEYDRVIEGYDVDYDAQLGTGVMTFGLTAEHSLNNDWGPVIFGGGYNYGGGTNDIGNKRGSSLTAYCYAGYRTDMMVHSVGANLSIPLSEDESQGNVIEGQSPFLLTLQYGIEWSVTYNVPVFAAILHTIGQERSQDTTSLALGVVASF
jgi:hypothetical protein